MTNPGGKHPDQFHCPSCGKAFRWASEIAGRSVRCRCGEKFRCPASAPSTPRSPDRSPAGDSRARAADLEDTVADVELEEMLDTIDSSTAEPGAESGVDVQELFAARRRSRGLFGMTLGAEVLFYFGMSLVGLAFAILAVILGKYFWWWIAAAVLVGPISWVRLWKRWQTWAAGRSFMVALADVFDTRDETPAG